MLTWKSKSQSTQFSLKVATISLCSKDAIEILQLTKVTDRRVNRIDLEISILRIQNNVSNWVLSTHTVQSVCHFKLDPVPLPSEAAA